MEFQEYIILIRQIAAASARTYAADDIDVALQNTHKPQ